MTFKVGDKVIDREAKGQFGSRPVIMRVEAICEGGTVECRWADEDAFRIMWFAPGRLRLADEVIGTHERDLDNSVEGLRKRAEFTEELLELRTRELHDARGMIDELKRELSERPAVRPAPTGKRWEYNRIPHPCIPAGDGRDLNYDGSPVMDTLREQIALDNEFNRLGADGWEFDRCYIGQHGLEWFVFRRELAS